MIKLDEDAAARLSATLQGGDFSTAYGLLNQYCEKLQVFLGQPSDSPSKAEAIEEAAMRLRLWLNLSIVMRSHVCEQLHHMTCEQSYLTGDNPAPVVQISA